MIIFSSKSYYNFNKTPFLIQKNKIKKGLFTLYKYKLFYPQKQIFFIKKNRNIIPEFFTFFIDYFTVGRTVCSGTTLFK